MLPNFVVNRILIIEKHLLKLVLFSWRLVIRCVYFYPHPCSLFAPETGLWDVQRSAAVSEAGPALQARPRSGPWVLTLAAVSMLSGCITGAHPGPPPPPGICAASAGHGVRETRAGRYQRWASGNTETVLRLRLSQWLRDMWDGHHQWPEWHESKVSQTLSK